MIYDQYIVGPRVNRVTGFASHTCFAIDSDDEITWPLDFEDYVLQNETYLPTSWPRLKLCESRITSFNPHINPNEWGVKDTPPVTNPIKIKNGNITKNAGIHRT